MTVNSLGYFSFCGGEVFLWARFCSVKTVFVFRVRGEALNLMSHAYYSKKVWYSHVGTVKVINKLTGFSR